MSLANTIRRAICLFPLLAVCLNAQPSPYRYFGQQSGERYGAAVVFLGDIDGDGDDEIAIGAPWHSENGTAGGKIDVRRRAGSVVYESFGVAFGEQFGSALDAVPDIDSDGVPELLVGAWGSSVGGFNAGRVSLLSGATGAPIWTRFGTNPGDRFGFDVANSGDTQGTGLPTVVVGAPGHNGGTGAAYILSAFDGSVIRMITAPNPSGQFGHAVTGAGSINAGAEEDVLIGAPFTDTNGTDSGHLYFVNGLTGTIISQVQGQTGSLLGFSVDGFDDVTGEGSNDYLTGAPAYTAAGLTSGRGFLRQSLNNGAAPLTILSGTQASESFGSQIARAGDRDGDGALDIICGGPGWDGPLGVNQGRVVICDQSSQQIFFASGSAAGEEFGSAVAGRGDYNGDGRHDLVVGAPRYDSALLFDVGRVVVYPAEGVVPYGTGLGGLNNIELAAFGSTGAGNVVSLAVTNGPAGGVGALGLALNPAQITVSTAGGPIILLLHPASLTLAIPYAYDAGGTVTISFYMEPAIIALVGGSTIYAQVEGVYPKSARLYASNGLAMTFGY